MMWLVPGALLAVCGCALAEAHPRVWKAGLPRLFACLPDDRWVGVGVGVGACHMRAAGAVLQEP